MTSSDIESIERATLAAVSPEAVEEFQGWLLPFDGGTVSRAHSAVPLRHVRFDAGMVDQIEARYRARGLRTVFRLANEACFDGLRQELARRGYQAGKPVLVQVAAVQAMRAACAATPAETADSPDAAWAALFLAEGFDPVDGASRVKALSRAHGSVYASVRENGKPWRRAPARSAMAGPACTACAPTRPSGAGDWPGACWRGLPMLRCGAASTGRFCRSKTSMPRRWRLYRRAGFASAWSYDYWRKP
jgi:hypothetical protein